MLAAADTHMGRSAHSSSVSPPPPSWHPVVLVPSHHHHQQQQPLYDHDLATPSPTTPAAAASPPRHDHLGPASGRRAGKRRRPRPSRKLPTTYISADAASFRRMVHQVTGADDVAQHQATTEVLCIPAPPSRAVLATTTLLPTLDTSAFLLGAARGAGDRAPPARPSGAFCRRGSAVDPGGGGGGVRGGVEHSCRNGSAAAATINGFSSLESWDDDSLFHE